MKLAINTDAISQDFETAVILALEWGIDCFELKRIHHKRVPDVTRNEVDIIKSVIRSKEVTLCSLAPGLFKIPLEPHSIAEEQGRLEQSLNLAEDLEVKKIIIFGFQRDRERTPDQAVSQIADVLGAAAERARARGCRLYVENERGQWTEDPGILARVMSAVNSPALGVNWDPGNVIGTRTVNPYPEGYEIIRQWVGHLHVKDLFVDAEGHHQNIMMGQGEVNWVGQFEALMKDGFDEFAVIEPHFGCRIGSSRSHIVETKRLLRQACRHIQSV